MSPSPPHSRWRGVLWLRRFLLGTLFWVSVVTVLLVLPLRAINPATSMFMLRASGQGAEIEQQWVALDRISPLLGMSVIAAEDQRFVEHHGIDLASFQAAFTGWLDGSTGFGGSTITQQTVKNLFLWPEKNALRKGLEIWLALSMDLMLPKWRILEIYLNLAQFGEAQYGVEAAAQHFFDRPASRLNASQSALLAAALPNPLLFRVDKPNARMRDRQRWIERQVRQLGGVSFLGRLQ
ncbi:monofunctional biosynthetic peptidoglycan transglycosylase [Gammaproteobacteria bacterium]|nr:monofunctional biosynthetic peptidoglycan transglycosylase [Gammaproteobacteria bacterium]